MVKANEATLNRPKGHRVIQAPQVFVSIPDYIDIVKTEKAWDENDRNGITVFKSDELSVVLTALKKSAVIENIQASGYMTLLVVQGKITVFSAFGYQEAEKNQMIVFNPSIQYSVSAEEDSSILLSHYNSPLAESDKIF